MAETRKEEFGIKEQEIAAYAKALSHPARIAILNVLAKKQTCICGEIVDILPLAQSTVSQHLRELKDAGLISGTVDGPRSCYCIDWKAFNKMKQTMGGFFAKLDTQKSKCC